MGGTESSNTHVANATGKRIRIYYSVEKMRMEEMVVTIGAGLEGSKEGVTGNVSAGTEMHFKKDSRIRYIRIPIGDFTKIAGEGELYASVFVECNTFPEKCLENICLNFHVPSDRSFIVTPNEGIRFQKYGASIWEDEYGNKY